MSTHTDTVDLRELAAALESLGYTHATRLNERAALTRLFSLNQRVAASELGEPAAATLRGFVDRGLIEENGGRFDAHVRAVPFHHAWFFVDSPARYRHQPGRYTYIGRDGTILYDFARPRMQAVRSDAEVLDLCAGSGLIGVTLARDFSRVTCADIHAPALQWAERNRDINDVKVSVVHSDLFEGVPGPFRVIIANPSYSLYPDAYVKDEGMEDYETGGAYGLELTERILGALDAHLCADGDAFVCTLDPTVRGVSLLTTRLHERFGERDYAVELHHLYRARTKFRRFQDFYRGLGISDLQFVIVHLRRGQPWSFRDVPLPRLLNLREDLRFALQHSPAYGLVRRFRHRG